MMENVMLVCLDHKLAKPLVFNGKLYLKYLCTVNKLCSNYIVLSVFTIRLPLKETSFVVLLC